jgi:hypothetical protein
MLTQIKQEKTIIQLAKYVRWGQARQAPGPMKNNECFIKMLCNPLFSLAKGLRGRTPQPNLVVKSLIAKDFR